MRILTGICRAYLDSNTFSIFDYKSREKFYLVIDLGFL